MSNIKGKVIVITGASSGIGRATALLLSKKGAKIVLGARREDRLKTIVKTIVDNGGEAIYAVTDVTKKEEVDELVRVSLATFGQVDVMFNNAGIMPLSHVESFKTDEWDKMVDVNIKGVLHGLAAVMPIMLEAGDGQIITTGSVASYNAEPTGVIYAGTKFAIRAIHEGLRRELDGRIKLTLLAPGVTDTELGEDITEEDIINGLKEIRKLAISPESIAEAVLFAINQPSNIDTSTIVVRQRGGNA
ncbi:SDR family oxidoreductase [Listeria ivanovii]|uniref:Short-chain dehydrogenase n=2 Tax=Listeria ivanovii TaxID=1638 RepID=Q5DU78_LISIV|nr:SDR family oxidoreductase [Listeria ivanovii]AHI55742.1 oxidoreductase [Listeria ivanovii WSLC3009]AIS65189.1 oxidoreductase [Listeria ivanovii subsp. ivanovii]MBC1760153.1 SDR family oxidoreductase [Listeria ivanovii]MBK3914659.1 SDR family oxidoreductase [Listeria ivanovii subsp. ivanovii]MBK3921443.1 SDR family oxidoreductase [Listeria ivanovii subsp. ivanovii]